MNQKQEGLQIAIDIIENFIHENRDGKKIEKMAETFNVPDSVAAVRAFEVVILERLKEEYDNT